MSTDDGETTGSSTWRDPRWRAESLGWAAERLARAGFEIAGESEQPHVRAWSTAFRVRLRGGGTVWLKAVGPGSRHEPGLTDALGGWLPDRELRAQCALALRVAPLARALTWHRILCGVHREEGTEWADAVSGWTAEHLAPGPLAGAAT